MSVVLVAIGGFIGSITRYSLSLKFHKRLLATWIANITGSMFLAFLFNLYLEESINDSVWLLLGVGFCGAYTTFSTFSNETLSLLMEKDYRRAALYVSSSFIVSIGAVIVVFFLF
ncbi:fluoride efflux transporter CrcB [Oceanobacillus massiliensis]|uniref:fluoride efflux transporter CrcB n=1 Tax=Oceanobacillus massiliensis TaxID=1465765 RepID=UPI000288CBE5|nr:fluoride efflux transporter CrcB [Oceanobacillus massiliensis]